MFKLSASTLVAASLLAFFLSEKLGRADLPAGTGTAVAAAVYGPPYNVASYRSPTLGANLLAQWMYIVSGGQQYTFWGARIVGLDVGSPLHALGVRPGDVITRLDGLFICDDMFQDQNGIWQLPEAERHFGSTEVRYIVTGTNDVRIGEIMLSISPVGPGLSPVAP